MPYVNVTKSEAGGNTGSSSGLVAYLEKENLHQPQTHQERWFNQERDNIRPEEVQKGIDTNVAKLKKTEAKFFLVNISPSEKELAHLGNDPKKLKEYAREVMDQYAQNFKKGIGGEDLRYYGKVEYNRYYKFTDAEVQAGDRKRGEIKEGNHLHVQVIVSRKDHENQMLLSPLNNSSGRNQTHSQKFGQFNQVNFKQSAEQAFDRGFNYQREKEESFGYQNTMQNGTVSERADLIISVRDRDRDRVREMESALNRAIEIEQQKQAEKLKLDQEQSLKQEKTLKPEIEIKHDKGISRGGGIGM